LSRRGANNKTQLTEPGTTYTQPPVTVTEPGSTYTMPGETVIEPGKVYTSTLPGVTEVVTVSLFAPALEADLTLTCGLVDGAWHNLYSARSDRH